MAGPYRSELCGACKTYRRNWNGYVCGAENSTSGKRLEFREKGFARSRITVGRWRGSEEEAGAGHGEASNEDQD